MEASVKNDYLMWDQRKPTEIWKYGFIQGKALAAAHGQLAAQVSVFPVSIFETGVASGMTSRFYDTKTFDCDQVICRGVVNRQRVFAKLVLADNDWVWVSSFNRSRLTAADNSKPLVDETEHLLAQNGGDDLDVFLTVLGKKQEKYFYGLVARQSRYKNSQVENDSQYLIFRMPWQDGNLSCGLGRYDSSHANPGLSAVLGLTWTWGESLALF